MIIIPHCTVRLNKNTSVHEIKLESNFKINHWLSSNKLSLSMKKTKLMVFHLASIKVNYPYIITNTIQIEMLKGFNFGQNPEFRTHINHISNTISKARGVIYRLK